MRKKRITVIVLAVMILAIGSFISMNFMTKFEIGSADGQESDKMVIRVDGWDIEYTICDRKLTDEDLSAIYLYKEQKGSVLKKR